MATARVCVSAIGRYEEVGSTEKGVNETMNIQQYLTVDLAIFVTIQMVNVIISTVKSILTVNGSKMCAAVVNAVSYTFANVVTKMLTQQPFEVIIATTLFTNIIGVYAAKWLMEKTRKERLWTVMATIRSDHKDDVENALQKRSIQYTLVRAENDRWFINIFSHSKAESAMIREILHQWDIRHTIVENRAPLWSED